MIRRDESDTFKLGGLIRHLLFLAYIIGALLAIDAVGLAGQYRTAALTVGWPTVWRDVTYPGRAFTLNIERSAPKVALVILAAA